MTAGWRSPATPALKSRRARERVAANYGVGHASGSRRVMERSEAVTHMLEALMIILANAPTVAGEPLEERPLGTFLV